jgi:two-component system sensor histidine kinase MprB
MKIKSIRWQLSLSYAVIALLATLLLGAIMLMILQRFYTNLEQVYSEQTAAAIGKKIAEMQKKEQPPEAYQDLLAGFSLFSNTQIRLLGTNKNIILDTGSPQEYTTLVFDPLPADNSDPKDFKSSFKIVDSASITETGKLDELAWISDPDKQPITIRTSKFPGWLISSSLDAALLDDDPTYRSHQNVQYPYFNQQGEMLGIIELSNGPAYGRGILYRVAWGWAIAAIAAVLLAAAAGMWVSCRFSAPLESLTYTTAQMSAGNLSARADIERQDEFGLLAISFNRMADNIEAKVVALRRFVADASHELGTPLTALRTNLEMIDDEHIPPALEQIDRMDSLTRSLLDLSRLEASASEMHYEAVDLAALLRNLAEPYASRAEQAELSFKLEIGRDTAKIKGDTAQIGTLIQNLLDNAIKFTPAGGQVNVKLSTLDETVQLCVRDNGIGIPEEDIPHLFSRFHRGRNASAYPGSGLGLAIVKAIADQHGAIIIVKRKSGGTVFEIRFIPCQSGS